MLVYRAVRAFSDLQNCENKPALADARKSSFQAARLLRALYNVGIHGEKFTPEDRITIGSAFTSASFAIGYWVSSTVDEFPPHNNIAHSRRERSGLQFLLDNYIGFTPEEWKKLSLLLQNFNDKEEMEEWDKLLGDESFRLSSEIIDFDLSDEEKEYQIPSTHRWCFNADKI